MTVHDRLVPVVQLAQSDYHFFAALAVVLLVDSPPTF